MKCLVCNTEFEPSAYEERMMFKARTDLKSKWSTNSIACCCTECFFGKRKPTKEELKANRHEFHIGKKGKRPTFGKFREVLITHDGFGDKLDKPFTRIVNMGGEIVVRPMTKVERDSCEKNRGRQGYSEGATVLVLPSAKFYQNPRHCHHSFVEDGDK